MPSESRFFSITELAKTLPEVAGTMVTDIRLTDEQAASCRILRVHRTAPAHYHTSCDEYLYVLSGRGEITIAEDQPREVTPGQLIFFRKRVVHALRVLEHPFTVLAVDTPRRPPDDVHFVNPKDGTPQTFIRTQY
jgi:mannose-6-phosphate isomerase-like protein (cupin superfamily)